MGGKAAEKDWGVENWLTLFRRFEKDFGHLGLLVVGAAEDRGRGERLLAQWRGPGVNACGVLTPRQSAAAMAGAAVFIGHDSGPLHLAAAMGAPCVGLFGDFNRPNEWHPHGRHVTTIHNMSGIAAITVDEVERAGSATSPGRSIGKHVAKRHVVSGFSRTVGTCPPLGGLKADLIAMIATVTESSLLDWLLNTALPFWAECGVDRRHGGFFEKVDLDGRPNGGACAGRAWSRGKSTASPPAMPSAGTARRPSWSSMGSISCSATWCWRMEPYAGRSAPTAVEVDDSYDPYDYAFVLFGLAAAARVLPHSPYLATIAGKVRDRLLANWKHPQIGFEQARPRTVPLKANPHMHLLEAFLAWDEPALGDDPTWARLAHEIVDLAMGRLIARHGAVYEHFDGDKSPAWHCATAAS